MQFFRIPSFSGPVVVTFLGAFGLALLSGCASQKSASPPPSNEQLCAALLDVVAQADARFTKYKSTPTISFNSGMTKWETKPVFPDSRCDVLEWVGGRINYICTWPEGTEAQARETYQKYTGLMERCLTSPWVKSETGGQTGAAAVFTRPNQSTQVVLRYFLPRGGFRERWETSLTIGDEVKAEAR